MNRIYLEAERYVKKCGSRNPYELLDYIGAHLEFVYHYPVHGLKGFSAIFNRQMYAVVNGNLGEVDRGIVVGHEAAHLILHRREILQSPGQAMKDFNLYCESSRLEYQANLFLANFLVTDKQVLDVIADTDDDFFRTSRALYFPPHLLGFKLHSMMRRGLPVRPPMGLQSTFLKG